MSVLRTVVLPRAVPARLARFTFLAVRGLLLLRLRMSGRSDYKTRDRVFALQAPVGLFAQLLAWSVLIFLYFAALFWALSPQGLTRASIVQAFELSGSSMVTLGIDHPQGLVRHLVAFTAAGVGLTLLALVVTYLPSLYGAFSRREALIAKLVVRAGSPPSGLSLLTRSWELARFEQLDEVWDSWENWFIELGESHTTFPQLGFFRSPHPSNHWVLAAEAVLDGAALMMTTCDVPRQSISETCVDAGVGALVAIADFLGIPHEPEPEADAEISLPREIYETARQDLTRLGVPVRGDACSTWPEFRRVRVRYEPLIAVLGRMTDAPRSDWSSWSDAVPRHSPPLIRIHNH
ncbi:MAG TPA: hypothetical protein VG365_14205 [Solirubrobacteraceae bacterium]|jgi:hypothetical protein|nr:hypothetical protein [Solirubrobacteraceae bacterium]